MKEHNSRTLPAQQGDLFDRMLSFRLDSTMLDLELGHSPRWGRWYCLRKRIAEINVPVWYPEARP